MASSSSNNNNINNHSSVDDSNNGQTNNNNGVPAVTGVMAWDLCPANTNNIPILTDGDVVMEDVEEKGADENNNRKRQGASDKAKVIKIAKKKSHNDEIVAVLEQRGVNENPRVPRTWYAMFMPDGTRALVRLVPTITTKELTRRLLEYFGNIVAARMPGTTEELKLDWSMHALDMLKVYTTVVMR